MIASSLPGQQPPEPAAAAAAPNPMLQLLRDRVQRDPQHSDSWRLIGKLEFEGGNPLAAMQAFDQSLQIDPENAAAHFDFGRCLLATGDHEAAQSHFQQCVRIAPRSEYAETLYNEQRVPRPAATPAVAATYALAHSPAGANGATASTVDPVGYEIQTFDGADDLDQRLNILESQADPTLKRLRVFIETGLLYNSNVSLTPISRELASADAESFQGFFNPELEFVTFRNDLWRSGTLARGYFTVNESSHSEFDLASFQPGAFIERDLQVGDSEWIGRVDYVYALDLLDGNRIGNRHSITASVIAIRPDLDVIYTYLTTSMTQFEDDGAVPAVNSLDGTSVSGGISRFFQTGLAWAPTYSLGVDLESANTEGSDFRYRAINGHGDVTFQLSERWSLVPSVGVGHRDYYDFTGPVNRDELTWRVQGKLRCRINDLVSMSLVAGHDRFASDNEAFDAERTQGGVVMTMNY